MSVLFGIVVGVVVGVNVTMWYYLFGSRTYMVIDRWWLENAERWEWWRTDELAKPGSNPW